jgi:hypothetical protein
MGFTAAVLLSGAALAGDRGQGHGNDRKERPKPLYDQNSVEIPFVDCFWDEPFHYGGKVWLVEGYGGANSANIDDIAASYWATRIKLGFGDRMILRGQFGHNRYGSIQSYGVMASTGSLRTDEIVPDEGSVNPYHQGNPRDLPGDQRWFTITVLNEPNPADDADKEPNTLYARPPTTDPDQTLIDLRWRSYLPDQKYDDAFDPRGGGQIPLPIRIVRADGSEEAFQCDRDPTEQTLQQSRKFTNSATPVQNLRSLWESHPCRDAAPGEFCNDPWTAPAKNPPVFEKFFNNPYSYSGLFLPPEEREALKPAPNCDQGGVPDIPANFDNNYMTTWISNNYGKVFRITGKRIRTPRTYWNEKVWDQSDAQLLYWSWTTGNERPTGQIGSGVSDEQVPTNADGSFSIVISKPEDRPRSATQECGHAWMTWNRRGDFSGRSGITTLTLRHTLPLDPDFTQGLLDVCEAGTEAEVMGEYLPVGKYFDDAAAFEKEVGCLRQSGPPGCKPGRDPGCKPPGHGHDDEDDDHGWTPWKKDWTERW